MNASASQVTELSQSLANGACEQAVSMEETSASSEEITAMTNRNTGKTRAAADLATQSETRFAQTNRSLEQLVVATAGISDASNKIRKLSR